ncbi:hydrogenase maturation nickel metallochaperone HypA [Corynebacterium choanae]|uniref:Hydrogenase nickel incorporation protein HybF n=1 Tax=Corynebacterium choanae TaxID=1862358 RepID=A0A3G6J9B9_9CORY|nr:hydrogenase maturation nickel metallochaperone HypA [Corynebacterium choanae]AZA14363.1 hydrogenase nickel incorporation protein HybF [Corynebacterium choanae]
MHELGLLTGVVGAVEHAAAGRTVTAVHLEVGSLAGVVVESLHAAWPLARRGVCADATLQVHYHQAAVWCPKCAQLQAIDEYFALTCPVCDTPTADLRQGREFTVSSIDVETPDSPQD